MYIFNSLSQVIVIVSISFGQLLIKNTCEKSTIDIDERENIQNVFIDIAEISLLTYYQFEDL